MTLEQVGARFGLTRERIRQLQEHAIEEMRERIRQLDSAWRRKKECSVKLQAVPCAVLLSTGSLLERVLNTMNLNLFRKVGVEILMASAASRQARPCQGCGWQ